jgi:phosphatidylethanolamine/phosphatidyl-N-methylethanolamine N-methyltransferase
MGPVERILPAPYRQFLRSWLADPVAVGAVAPSGRQLARVLTRELEAGDRVVELGPGTGTVTREILARGIAPGDCVLIERCHRFATALEFDYPGITVVCGDATLPQDLPALVPRSFDVIVSGLPLVLFSREQKSRLLGHCFDWLKEHGAVYQFTYGGRCPVDRRLLHRHGLVARIVGFVAMNMPPAFVYRIARQGAFD